MPLVSVIIPNFNHSIYLKQRIESVLSQTFKDFELILLDDCSTDNSSEILSEYKNHPKVSHLILNSLNSGSPFKQWNKGVELAKGEYVWIAESDDWAENDFLENLVFEITNNNNIGLAYSLVKYVSATGQNLLETTQSGKIEIYNGNDFIKDKLLSDCLIDNVSSVIFKRELYYKINHSLYENMKLCGDWFFYVLISEISNVLICNKVLSNFRRHEFTTSLKEEIQGNGILEGIVIFNYITKRINGVNYFYSCFLWGKKWFKNNLIYHYTKKTNHLIFVKLLQRNKIIVLAYLFYQQYYALKLMLKH